MQPVKPLLNLNQLRYFYSVAQTGNIQRAALELGISQPALSKQIQALEDTVGQKLLHRQSRGIVLTATGETMLRHCTVIFRHVTELELRMLDLRLGNAGELVIGTVNSIGVHILPAYLKEFRASHPRAVLRVVYQRSLEVLRLLREKKVDIAVVPTSRPYEGLRCTPFMSNPMVLVCAPDHPLAKRTEVHVADLYGRPFISFTSDSPTRELTDRLFESHKVTVRNVIESENSETIKKMVEIGMGLAIMPTHVIAREVETGTLVVIPMKNVALSRDLSIYERADEYVPVLASEFIALVLGESKPNA